MKPIFFFLLLFAGSAQSQAVKKLTLSGCYELARQNYPLIRQRDLINKTRDLSVHNASIGYLPKLAFLGQGTYQSDVVDFPGLVGVAIPALNKGQYKVGAEINQTIYDGGLIHNSRQNQEINAELQQQNLEVNLYTIRDRINNIYFGILYIQQQIKQNELRLTDMKDGLQVMQSAYANGDAYRSNVDELKAEVLNVEQNTVELKSNKTSYQNMLGLMINQKVDDSTQFEEPVSTEILVSEVNRPELKLFDIQRKNTDLQEQQLRTGYLPQVNAFAQGFYGAPTYNFISNDPGLFGIVGISFRWNLYNLYTNKNSRSIYELNRRNIDVQKETFLFNTQLSMAQDSQTVVKYRSLFAKDEEIIKLRSSVKDAAKAQLENGVLTSHDYITKVNDESQARLSFIEHRIQWLQAQYNFKNVSGN